MGERSRRDPAGHQQNAQTKGHPTPKAPQNAPAVPGTPPLTRMAAWIQGANAQIGGHENVQGDILSLHLAVPGGIFTVKMPLEGGWDAICDVVAAAKAQHADEQRAAASKIHLPGGVDLAAEARAHEQLRKGPDHA